MAKQANNAFTDYVFRTRCLHACGKCRECAPEMAEVSPAHKAACHFALSAKEKEKADETLRSKHPIDNKK